MVKVWYKEDRKKYLTELKAIRKITPIPRLYISKTDNLCLEGKIIIKNIEQYYQVLFPHTYPKSPPKFWPYTDFTYKNYANFEETTHQNRDESLCLFTGDGGPGDWKFNMNILTAIEKFKISLIKAKEHKHTDDHTSLLTPLPGRRKSSEIYIPKNILKSIIESDEKYGDLELFSFKDGRPLNFLFFSILNKSTNKILEKFPWKDFDLLEDTIKGIYIKIPINLNVFRRFIKKEKNLIEILKNLSTNIEIIKNRDFIIFVFADTEVKDDIIINPNDFNPHCTFLYKINDSDLSDIYHIPLYDVYQINIPNDFFQRTYGVLEDALDEINKKRVLIIGLGSLGATITLELAKSGISKFILYDFDTFQAVNVCRHTGNLFDIGKYKTKILKTQILRRNPNADVENFEVNPFKDNNLEQFEDNLKKSDLVIITTGDHISQFLLNDFAIQKNIPVIYGWCGPNAVQGRVFRVFPLKTPCYHCINLQLENEPKIFPRISKPFNYRELPQFEGYRQPGIPGISIDINFIGLFITRFAMQTLFRESSSYQDSLSDHYIWQNKQTELSGIEIGIIAFHEFNRIPNCPICNLKRRVKFHDRKTEYKIQLLEKKLLTKKKKK